LAAQDIDLGDHIRTHGRSGGLGGLESKRWFRHGALALAGAAVGFIPGLFVALITDLVPALIIGPILGGIAGYLWSRGWSEEGRVTEARLHARGVVLIDDRGTHHLPWDRIASIQGRRTQTVLSGTPVGDVKGRTTHMYVLRVRDGMGFWLDDRIKKVGELADTIAASSGVMITPMR
jgi:hypothetical protein